MTKHRPLAVLALLIASCDDTGPARAQWVVTLATDAPIPALGDRVLVEVYDEDGFACSSCRRAFGTADASRWPLSFGIRADSKAKRIRVRLFRSDTLGEDGTPQSVALIDAIATLPPDPDGVDPVTLVLGADCFGVPADVTSNTTCDPTTGGLVAAPELAEVSDPPAAGTWAPAVSVPCTAATPTGMACIPGGVFILGDPVSPPSADPSLSTVPERLVKLPPFFLDVHEATLGEYVEQLKNDSTLPPPGGKSPVPGNPQEFCQYDPDALDPGLPLNCIPQFAAARYCELKQKRLPTEAEWEYAASNGQRDDRYPWGVDADICAHAVVARSLVSLCRNVDGGTLDPGPVASGSTLDVDIWGIQDLGGNVSEWVADTFQAYGVGCWSGEGLLTSPLCADDSSRFAVRGGNWAYAPISSRAALRSGSDAASSTIGVRCALSGG